MYFKNKKFSRRDILFGLGRNFRTQDASVEKTGFGLQAQEIDGQMRAGDYGAAAEALQMVLHKSPDHVQARKNFGFCLMQTERLSEAETQFRQVLQDKQNDPFALLYLGLVLLKQGRTAEAVSWWKGYFNPDQPIINRVLNMQISLYDMGSLGSKEEIEKSVEIAIREQKASDGL